MIYPRTEHIDAHLLRGWPNENIQGQHTSTSIRSHPSVEARTAHQEGVQKLSCLGAFLLFLWWGIMVTDSSTYPLRPFIMFGPTEYHSGRRSGRLSCYGRCDNWFRYSFACRSDWMGVVLRHITTNVTHENLSKVLACLSALSVRSGGDSLVPSGTTDTTNQGRSC